jgi:ABC-type dipeptide/oligopeptide/nickel transport system permease subunit
VRDAALTPAAAAIAPGRRAWRRFARNRAALVGGILVLAIAALAAAAPLVAGDPYAQDFDRGLTELGAPVGPGAYLLGTDALGRDVWARAVHGARLSLAIGIAATLLALAVGLAVGLIAGYAGGRTDAALMRLVDLVLSFPFLLLAIALAALLRGTGAAGGAGAVLVVLGLVGWTTMARVIRGKVLAVRELEFVQAARALGASSARILVRHVAPNVVGPAVVLATITVAQMILAESTLSYLGLGAPPPAPTWGRMLYEGQPYYRSAPWLIAVPGVAVLATVLAFNLLGEGLRDALDPKERR